MHPADVGQPTRTWTSGSAPDVADRREEHPGRGEGARCAENGRFGDGDPVASRNHSATRIPRRPSVTVIAHIPIVTTRIAPAPGNIGSRGQLGNTSHAG